MPVNLSKILDGEENLGVIFRFILEKVGNIDKISQCAVPTTRDFSKSMTVGQEFQ